MHFAKSVKIGANEYWWNQKRQFMGQQDPYLTCQLADSFNEQTDTEMHSAKGQKYGKPIQFGHVLPYWYGYLVLLSTTNILSKSSVCCRWDCAGLY